MAQSRDQSSFQPRPAPSLRTAVFNCVASGTTPRVCGTFRDDFVYFCPLQNPQKTLTTALRTLAPSSNYPVIERFWLLDRQDPFDDDGPLWPTYKRREFVKNKTWPFRLATTSRGFLTAEKLSLVIWLSRLWQRARLGRRRALFSIPSRLVRQRRSVVTYGSPFGKEAAP